MFGSVATAILVWNQLHAPPLTTTEPAAISGTSVLNKADTKFDVTEAIISNYG